MGRMHQKNKAVYMETKDPDGYRICRTKSIEMFLSNYDMFIYETGNLTSVLSEYEISRIVRDGKLLAARSREGIMW